MSEIVIKVNNLSKQYYIGADKQSYKTLRETITNTIKSPYSKLSQAFDKNKKQFWALKDISLEVRQGEVVGVIGHNGAGKSTLLKVLARITEPTTGVIDIHGRVGSLLEVGTGFHPELTGRENIYLSGAILGMRKNEIARRFDEIVAFSEVGRFMNTPLKHYSSGMYLRLAFAVAAHLEPEILLVDEVLAVGDMAFQKKCLNKMEDVATNGRTILFVSHNMGAIKELCQTALVLNNGAIDFYGPVIQAIQHYSSNVISQNLNEKSSFSGNGWRQINVKTKSSEKTDYISNKESFEICANLVLDADLEKAIVSCIIEDCDGLSIAHNFADKEDVGLSDWKTGSYQIEAEVPPLWLKPSIYTLHLKLIGRTFGGQQVRCLSERVVLDISDKTKQSSGKIKADILPAIRWSASLTRER